MPFYNMLLRVAGHTWKAWQELRTTSIIPIQRPTAAPPYRRKLKNAPTSICSNKNKRKLLLSAFALLNQSLVHGQGLSLSSELKEREALRKHRDCYGMLATASLQPDMREALQNTIRLDSACFHSIMHDYESVRSSGHR